MTEARSDWLFTVAVLLLLSSEYPIAVTLVDEQVEAVAARVKGEVTEAPFVGLLTLTDPVLVVAGSTVVALLTVREMSVTQDEPLLPHAFT